MSLFTPTNQIRFTNVSIVRQKKKGKKFEVACYRNKIVGWHSGIETKLEDVVQSLEVFRDVSTGTIAQRKDLLECYDTDNVESVVKEILKKGAYQMSDMERKTALQNRFKEISSKITTMVVSEKTLKQYPQSLIEKALKEVHFRVTLTSTVKKETREAIESIKNVLPLIETKLLISIILFKTQESIDLGSACLELCHSVLSDTTDQSYRILKVVIRHFNLNKLKKITEDIKHKHLVKAINIEDTSYID